MPDGTRWDVPAEVITKHRAEYYAKLDKGAFEKEFENGIYNLKEWAANNMNWSDVVSVAKKAELIPMPPPDYQEGWVNGHKEILDY